MIDAPQKRIHLNIETLDALLAAAVREGMSISSHTATAKFDQATRTFVRDKSADETAIAEAVKRIKETPDR